MTHHYGLIFDVDGVIADSETVNAQASARVLHELCGIPDVRREDFITGLGRGAEAYLLAATRVHGVEPDGPILAAAVALRQQYCLAILTAEPLPAFPGVLELIAVARADGAVALAIATSSAREMATAVLTAAGVPFGEMVFVAGDEVVRRKPDPELFLTAASRIGLAPARCLVIEDAPDGVAAARAAGCGCLAVTNSVGAAALAAADRVVDSLATVDLAMVRRIIDRH